MSSVSEPLGTLDVALSHAAKLLEHDPAAAVEQAAEILKAVPRHPAALLLMAIGHRSCGAFASSLSILEPLVIAHPNWAAAHYELGITCGLAQQGDAAVAALKRAVHLKADMGDAWRALADHLHAVGDIQSADQAYARHLRFSTRDPRLLEAAAALCDNRIAPAEALLREHLKLYPTDIAAIRMLAEVAARLGRYGDAEHLLARCLELAPGFEPARYNYAIVLLRQNKTAESLIETQKLLAIAPGRAGYRNLKAAILGRLGEYEESIELYRGVLAEYPHQAKAWMSYGHALKTAGRREACIEAYRKCIALSPMLGEAWWSLANLKTFRFSAEELATMRSQLDRADLSDTDRFHFHFAVGKALEDAEDYESSFEHYAKGNTLRRTGIDWDAAENASHVRRSKALFTKSFLASRQGWGCAAPDPIFIVSLPRSGSTLLEQILSSHSAVEGTMELPDVIAMARTLGARKTKGQTSKYPDVLASLSEQELRELGEQYLAQTRIQRKTDSPFFIDKMPNNFAHTGLIHLMLPNAKIIDARRHPLGCCFSGFKQHFARGQNFAYGLDEIGAYYRDYVELMAHFDEVLPGRVHRVFYETMIDHTESEVRRLLDYCGLPFEDACLRFYENGRAVRTASSEQVRQPIFREGVDHWRHYDPWLGPLRDALGSVLEVYPAVPGFD